MPVSAMYVQRLLRKVDVGVRNMASITSTTTVNALTARVLNNENITIEVSVFMRG